MFRKKCPMCDRTIEKNFDFCPFCGYNLKREKDEKDFGLLGKDDDFINMGMRMPFGFSKIINSLMKQIDFESLMNDFGEKSQELDKRTKEDIEKNTKRNSIKPLKRGFSINISTINDGKPQIRINEFGNKQRTARTIKPTKKIEMPEMTEEKAKKYTSLPKKEAETKVRRLSNKIIYEITLPGVKTIKNIFINKLENSIEIKAFSDDEAYFKLIPVNLQIIKYSLRNEKFILELKP